jgi:hypothetical protein
MRRSQAQFGIPDINAPKRAAQKAADAENRQLSEQTGQALPSRTVGLQSGPAAGQPRPAGRGVAAIPTATSPAPGIAVTREIFSYPTVGRRDPFYSLILTEDLRPLLSDLRLVGILYEPAGRRSVAIMRDLQTNVQYRVVTGQTIGRMRVAQIKSRGVVFTIDEFGLSRQDSLMLSEPNKVRN